MVHTRRYTTICFILSVSLFMAGMYFDTGLSDTLFAYNSIGKVTFSMRMFRTGFNDAKICTTEMMGECSEIGIQAFELEPFLYIVCTNYISLLQRKSSKDMETVQSCCQTLDALVANYIHLSDGKK